MSSTVTVSADASCKGLPRNLSSANNIPMYILPWFQATYQASLRFCPRAKTTMKQHHSMQEEAAAAKAADDKAAQDEVDRQQRIKDSFDAQMPDEISQKVQAALQKEMVSHHTYGVCQNFLPTTDWDLGVHTCHEMSKCCCRSGCNWSCQLSLQNKKLFSRSV